METPAHFLSLQGNNWCSPYKDWKLLYDNDPVKILKSFGVNVTDAMKKTILGQESAMWSEQVIIRAVDLNIA